LLAVVTASTLIFVPSIRSVVLDKVLFRDVSGQIRLAIWDETIKMLSDGRALSGAGLANYKTAIAPYHQSGIYLPSNDPEYDKMIKISLEYQQKYWQPMEIYPHAHNFFLIFWSETGLAGLIIFILIVGKFFYDYFKVKDEEARRIYKVLCFAMLAMLIHGLVDAIYFKNDLSVLFFLILGMGVWASIVDIKKLLEKREP